MTSELEEIFFDRPFEEVEDGFDDEGGFYTTPNGSFWDDKHNYFNHFRFDIHRGMYDKYGFYIPGPGYDEKTGLYFDEKDTYKSEEKIEPKEIQKNDICKLLSLIFNLISFILFNFR